MKKKLAFLLAAALILASLAGVLPAGAAGDTLILSYPEGKAGIGDVIQGDRIRIKASNTQNYSRRDPGLMVQDSLDADRSSEFQINLDGTPGVSEEYFWVQAKKPDGMFPNPGYYRITSTYNAMKTTATTVQTSGDSEGAAGTMVLMGGQSAISISNTSQATLTYEGGSKFTLSGQTGRFRDWKTVAVLSAPDSMANRVDLRLDPDPEDMGVISSASFTFTHNSYYFVDGVKTNGLKAGMVFRLTLSYVPSNDLGLNVYAPRDVLNAVAENAVSTGGATGYNAKYVRMTGTNNDFNFITGTVQFLGITEEYGRKINLTWSWKPDGAPADPPYGTEIPGDLEWKPHWFERQQENTTGTLYVKAGFRDAGFHPGVYSDIMSVRATIAGTGIPTKVEMSRHWTGQAGGTQGTAYPEPEQIPPSSVRMDLYKGEVANYTPPVHPYQVRLRITPGSGNAYPYRMVVTSSDSGVLAASVSQGGSTQSAYPFGASYTILGENPIDFTIVAQKTGTARLEFQFYIDANGMQIKDPVVNPSIAVQVDDTSPDGTARLKAMSIQNEKKENLDGFAFSPATYTYGPFDVPYSTQSLRLTPVSWDTAHEIIGISVEMMDQTAIYRPVAEDVWQAPGSNWVEIWPDNGGVPGAASIGSGRTTAVSVQGLPTGRLARVTLRVRAQNPNITQPYTFMFRRMESSGDSRLKTLRLFDVNNKDWMSGFLSNQHSYRIEVPYGTKMLRVGAEKYFSGASDPEYDPPLQKQNPLSFGPAEWIHLGPYGTNTTQTITVEPENQNPDDRIPYSLVIVRSAPASVATLSNLKITDAADKTLNFTPKFSAGTLFYALDIPYSVERIKVAATPADPGVSSIRLMRGVDELAELAAGLYSPATAVSPTTGENPYDALIVRVTAEDEVTFRDYEIRVTRAEPSSDAMLSMLRAADQDGKAVDIDFFPEVYAYPDLTVPYETTRVSFTPTSAYAAVKSITVDGKKTPGGSASPPVSLNYPGSRQIDIVVTAEDGVTSATYSYTLTRSAPSGDARLVDLAVGAATDFKPVFAPNRAAYTANVADGAKGVTVTPTANHKSAVITVEGKKVASGTVSDTINILERNQTVTIVVTAQDGTTTMTYTVAFYNPNLLTRSSIADLRSLQVNYGLMTPDFKPSVTTYEVTVDEEASSVDIIPQARDSLATVKVYAGSKEIGDASGNYAQAIEDGENEFFIEVTSPDETVTKEYAVTVFRNEEDKLKTLRPTTAADIDFKNTGDVVVVDISKYTRVSSDIFEALGKYPEKTIVFQGNDYSLEFRGADLGKIIPNTQVYDFGLRFTSPLEDEIWDRIHSHGGNNNMHAVMLYFKHHGALPAPARLTLSLRDRYKNRRMYWHYYNEERGRIDHYGYFDTNSRGTFTVTLDHMSTYMATNKHIQGSENKTGSATQETPVQNGSSRKINPDTGVKGGCA